MWTFHAAAAVKAERGCLSQDAQVRVASTGAGAREPGRSTRGMEGVGL